jgi:hypothetical protein
MFAAFSRFVKRLMSRRIVGRTGYGIIGSLLMRSEAAAEQTASVGDVRAQANLSPPGGSASVGSVRTDPA